MKIVTLKAHVGLKAGGTKPEVYFTTEANANYAPAYHRGLKLEPAVHPILGPGIMVETEALKKLGRVTFCPINNVEEIVFESPCWKFVILRFHGLCRYDPIQ